MSEADKRVAEYVAQTVIARLLDAVQDPDTVNRIMGVWGGEIDRTIGRGLRRLGFYVLIGLVGIASVKLGLLDKLGAFLFDK